MAGVSLPLRQRSFGETSRRDRWWVQPALVFAGLSAFIVYATWAAFQGRYYTYGPYLSPFYSPELWGNSPHAWFGPPPGWWPRVILIFVELDSLSRRASHRYSQTLPLAASSQFSTCQSASPIHPAPATLLREHS